jgi:hypothetical protein
MVTENTLKICSYTQRFAVFTSSGRLVKNILRKARIDKNNDKYILYNKKTYKVYTNDSTPLTLESILPHIVVEMV